MIWMDFEIYLKDAGRMIAALRAVEAFCASSSQHTPASEKAGELRAALANALES